MPCPGNSGNLDLGGGLFPLGSQNTDPMPLQCAYDFLLCLKGVCGPTCELEWGPNMHCFVYFGSR